MVYNVKYRYRVYIVGSLFNLKWVNEVLALTKPEITT